MESPGDRPSRGQAIGRCLAMVLLPRCHPERRVLPVRFQTPPPTAIKTVASTSFQSGFFRGYHRGQGDFKGLVARGIQARRTQCRLPGAEGVAHDGPAQDDLEFSSRCGQGVVVVPAQLLEARQIFLDGCLLGIRKATEGGFGRIALGSANAFEERRSQTMEGEGQDEPRVLGWRFATRYRLRCEGVQPTFAHE